MTDTTPRLALSELSAAQAQKHVTVNENLIALDAFINCQVTSMALTTPPVDPEDGDCYIVADDATDNWADYDGKIAYCIDGDWSFYTPFTGQMIYNAADATYYRYSGSAWVADFPSLSTSNTWSAKQTFTGGVSIGSYAVSLGGALTTGGALTFSGAYSASYVIPGAYTWTMPAQTGTLAELELAQTWTKKQTIDVSESGVQGLEILATGNGTPLLISGDGNMAIALNQTGTNAASTSMQVTTNGLNFISSNNVVFHAGDYYINSSAGNGSFCPGKANAQSNGSTNYPWSDVVVENDVTVTSGRESKSDIEAVADNDTLLLLGWDFAGIVSRYKMNAAIAAKGDDAARWHYGWIAQDIIDACDNRDVDASLQGFVAWENISSVTTIVTTDTDGNATTVTYSNVSGDDNYTEDYDDYALTADDDDVTSSVDDNDSVTTLTKTETDDDSNTVVTTTTITKLHKIRLGEIEALVTAALYAKAAGTFPDDPLEDDSTTSSTCAT